MSRALRIVVAVVALFGGAVSPSAAEDAPLARGTAITDPDLLRQIDQDHALSISHLLSQIPYEEVPRDEPVLPERQAAVDYVDQQYPYRYVPEKF